MRTVSSSSTTRLPPARGRRRRWLRRLRRALTWRSLRYALSSEGWSYLIILTALFIGAMIRGVNLLLLLWGMLLGPLLLNWRFAAVGLRRLEIRRRLPRTVGAGEQFVGAVELRNTRPRIGSWAVVVEDRVEAEAETAPAIDARPVVFFPSVPAGESRTISYRGRLPERGWYRFGPLRISTRFPFGLVRHTRLVGQPARLLVHPRLGRLTPAWQTRQYEAFEGSHRLERRRSNASGDLYGTREWRYGDSRRWIHWRSSAKHGHLVVRHFEQNRNRDLALVVDLWQPPEPSAHDRDNVELAISFAATVVADMCRKGDAILVLAVAGRALAVVAGAASAALLQESLECLALAAPAPDDRLAEVLEQAAARMEPTSELVVITPRATAAEAVARMPRASGASAAPARRAAAARARVISSADDSLADYFYLD